VTRFAGRQTPDISTWNIAHAIASAAEIDTVALSPDGEWLAYRVIHGSSKNDELFGRLFVQSLASDGSANGLPIAISHDTSILQWKPVGATLTLLTSNGDASHDQLIGHDPGSGQTTQIPFIELPQRGERPAIAHPSQSFRWSPSGTFIVFAAALRGSQSGNKRVCVLASDWQRGLARPMGLFLLDTRTGLVKQVTDDSVLVSDAGGFSWSPDEQQIAFAASRSTDALYTSTRLMVVNLATGAVRTLVDLPGANDTPIWSPDGSRIAFASNQGSPLYVGRVATLLTVATGEVTAIPGIPGYRSEIVSWGENSLSAMLIAANDMTQELYVLDVENLSLSEVKIPARDLEIADDAVRSFSGGAKRVAFIRSNPATPQKLLVADLDEISSDGRVPRVIVDTSGTFAYSPEIHCAIVRWRSRDGQFLVHGLLMTPRDAWNRGRMVTALPTAVCIQGGPSMIPRGFRQDGFRGIMMGLAARGYAVLSPMTRGRDGHSEAFFKGIQQGRTYLRLPLEDVISGVDHLISEGVADAEQLAILGQSYGAHLTQYAITQSRRFKAAVSHEALSVDYMDFVRPWPPTSWESLLARDMYGVRDPFDPVDRAEIIAQSPSLNTIGIVTPTLCISGTWSSARVSAALNDALANRGVPHASYWYDDDHLFFSPANVADSITRTIEWLDFWVRGIPYPDCERSAEFESWRGKDSWSNFAAE
jgi:dipeptidyl aminopeptidase/acylaminoacyl peptidase